MNVFGGAVKDARLPDGIPFHHYRAMTLGLLHMLLWVKFSCCVACHDLMVLTNHGLGNTNYNSQHWLYIFITILQQEDQIMEATEGLSEATGLQSQSVVALAQLANSDRVSLFTPHESVQ